MFGKEATKPLSEKPVFGTQSPRPLLTIFTLEPTMRPASNTSDPRSSTNTMSAFEPVSKRLALNTTAYPPVNKPPPLPSFEPSAKDLASNTTDPRSTYYNKLLELFTFNPDKRNLASNTSLFHFNPYKPMNDWKPFNTPVFKPKLHAPRKAPGHTSRASGPSGPLVIAKVIAGVSGAIIILILICCCIYAKRLNRPRKERRPRRTNGRPWFYDSEPMDFGGNSPRYSYTNPDYAESQDYKHENDFALEMGTEPSFDLNCYDNDTGGTSYDCAQD